MGVSLNLDFEQIKALVAQLPSGEKEQLSEYLDEETLFQRFEKTRASLRDVPITMEQITAEVERVREELYRAGRH